MSLKNHPRHVPCLPSMPEGIAFTVFCTALRTLLALNQDNENTKDKTDSSSQITLSFSNFDHNTPFQLFKEQIARRRESYFCISYSISEQSKQQDDFLKPLALGWEPETPLI